LEAIHPVQFKNFVGSSCGALSYTINTVLRGANVDYARATFSISDLPISTYHIHKLQMANGNAVNFERVRSFQGYTKPFHAVPFLYGPRFAGFASAASTSATMSATSQSLSVTLAAIACIRAHRVGTRGNKAMHSLLIGPSAYPHVFGNLAQHHCPAGRTRARRLARTLAKKRRKVLSEM
jgi:hypothetical protein